VKLREELREESEVLGLNRKDTQSTKFFGDADVGPGNLALPTIAVFLPGPEKGAPPLVNSLDDACGEKASAHGVGEHRSEDKVNKKETPPIGRHLPRQPESLMSLLDMMGAKSARRSLCVDRGRPR
jgi:hypothetical protein